jgi:hypothetical protein
MRRYRLLSTLERASKAFGTLVLTVVAGCSSVGAIHKDTEVFCPKNAFIEAEKTPGPVPRSFEDFKLWVGKMKANEAVVVESYVTLRECWDFYHGGGKASPPK